MARIPLVTPENVSEREKDAYNAFMQSQSRSSWNSAHDALTRPRSIEWLRKFSCNSSMSGVGARSVRAAMRSYASTFASSNRMPDVRGGHQPVSRFGARCAVVTIAR